MGDARIHELRAERDRDLRNIWLRNLMVQLAWTTVSSVVFFIFVSAHVQLAVTIVFLATVFVCPLWAALRAARYEHDRQRELDAAYDERKAEHSRLLSHAEVRQRAVESARRRLEYQRRYAEEPADLRLERERQRNVQHGILRVVPMDETDYPEYEN